MRYGARQHIHLAAFRFNDSFWKDFASFKFYETVVGCYGENASFEEAVPEQGFRFFGHYQFPENYEGNSTEDNYCWEHVDV